VPTAALCRLDRIVYASGVTVLAFALAGMPATVAAQDTRAGEIAQKQEEKAKTVTPYKPTGVEKFMNRLEETYTSPPSGFFPAVGSIYPGGGLALGLGFRQFFAGESVFDIKGLYSIKSYKQVEVGTRIPWHMSGKVNFGVRGGFLDATQVGFFGIGPDTLRGDRANFRIKETYGGATLHARPGVGRLEAEVMLEDYKNEEGLGRAPSIETVFDGITAPGLFRDLTYIHSQGTAAIDWRTSPGYSRVGGYYGVTFHDYNDRDKTYSFRRVDGELIQHVPLLRETWVLSFRGRVQSTVGDDDLVPYFLLPYLGSGTSLRGYPTGRFRDRHALLTSAEFRWIASRVGLDMAIFYDAGKVANRREDLDFSDLKSDWGIGLRFHGPTVTPLRIEGAKAKEGWRLVISSSAAF
jgi:surface antigen Omp85-like protein